MQENIVIRAAHIGKTFASRSGKELVALDNVSLAANEGEFVCLLGPSGCGKSTLLRILAGLETHFEGNVFSEGEEVAGPSRKRGMVFQEYSLFPWRNIEENVAAGLEFAGVRRTSAGNGVFATWSSSDSRGLRARSRTSFRAVCARGRRSPAPWRPIRTFC
mgnify:CR=1 FL=1